MTTRETYTHLSQSDIALQIERLVQVIGDSDSPAFRIKPVRSGYERIQETRLSRYFDHIQQMVDLFEDRIEYRYNEHLQAFRAACQDVGLERHPDGPACLNERGTAYLDHHHSMNVLVARIRQLTRERWYLRRKHDLRHQAKEQEIQVCGYVDALCELYSRITIIRVDFHYRCEAQARLRVEHVFDDLDQLIAKHRHNVIFEHLIGHIYSVEQGDRNDGGGYHVHAAYFFNGNEVQGDVYKAIQLGELWEGITHGQGYIYSCNHDKEQYGDGCGIGRILRSDRVIRRHVHKAVKYLVKDAQHLRLRPDGARCLRTGQLRLPRR
ncbi:inovirus-type Gp2 protein [Pseudomonas fulva]|uniref:inovirus-type Gp2 protein n=1 Tax=Pseudomonas TaxID=286 RepID=UPI001F284BE0|nr:MULTISPECIES: inovirus-type Gp2 protein [Pseudomonas]MCE5975296.1 inovirus-type Gp2 protein [Pseudomonas sp. JR33AA]MDF3928770.1 inovirus-type Gp2 protein [Pseudomonas putida]